MIYVKTHLKADEKSHKSGVYYPREVFERLIDQEYNIPGAFDVNVHQLKMDDAVNTIKKNQEFTVIGFDLIDDSLFLKVNSSNDEKFYEADREVKIIMSGKYEIKDGGKYLTHVYSIDAVSLMVEDR